VYLGLGFWEQQKLRAKKNPKMGQELSLGANIKSKKNRGYYPKARPKVPKTPRPKPKTQREPD